MTQCNTQASTGCPSAAIVTPLACGHITIQPACHAKGLLGGEVQMDNRRGYYHFLYLLFF